MSKETWEMRRDEFSLAELSDEQLGGLYRDWVAMWEYIGAYPDKETLAKYAVWARDILDRQAIEEAGDFIRFARIRLAGQAMGYGLASVETAYKNGKDYPDFHHLVVKRALADGRPVPPEVIADYPDLAAALLPQSDDEPLPPVSDEQAAATWLLLPDGRPRALLPDTLVEKLRPRHVLVYDNGNERFPCYTDGVLVIQGILLPHIKHWVAHYRTTGGDVGIHLWEGAKIGGVDIIVAEMPPACAAVLCEHLAAWGHQVEIVLAESSSPPTDSPSQARPDPRPAKPEPAEPQSKVLDDGSQRQPKQEATQLALI